MNRYFALLLLLPYACGGPSSETQNHPTWEQFLAQSTKVVDGREIYIVEWDRPIASIEALREYYDRAFQADDGLSVTEDSLMVNVYGGEDDYWKDKTATHLRYCISDDFGRNKSRARSEMHVAASSWARLANVAFIDDPTEDDNCDNTNNNVTFAVRPWSSGGACAFFPSGESCIPRTLVMDFNDFDTNSFWPANAPNLTTTGVFRHELGHILGFRHEHTNQASGTCWEDADWRQLTDYDPSSVMHYQWCNGVSSADLSLTDKDERGSVSLYGAAVPPMAAVLF
jgi:hypothetical protein